MESKEFQKQRNICTKYKPYVRKSTSGITLIALVVTIIVLLILAGISINLILGDNGIIKKARLAKEAQEMAQLKEEAELVKATGLAENLSKVDGEYGKADLLEDLNNNFEGSTLGSDRITTSDGKYDIIVDDDLNITVEKSGQVVVTGGITITSEVGEYEGEKYIALTFGIEGLGNITDYAMDKIFPDKDLEDLEDMFEEKYGQQIAEDAELVQEIMLSEGLTYEQVLKMILAEESEEVIMFNEMYNYSCKALGEDIYKETDDLENQLLEIWEYEGTYEEALQEKKGLTQEEMETQWLEDNSDFTEYNHELCLKELISQELDEKLTAIVQVINEDIEDSITVSLGCGDIGYMIGSITESGGKYTFKAELPDGRTGELTVIAQKSEEVVDPDDTADELDPDGWEVAWTCTDGTTWSEQITNDGTTVLEGNIIAKFYNTGNTITPQTPEYLGGSFLDEGPEYKLVFEGSGNMASLNIDGGFKAWVNTQYCYYVTEVIISDGIKNIADSTFYAFVSLETIEIPETVENIGETAFLWCHKLTSSITIPEEMTSIPEQTFSGCSSITEITIHDNITSIGEYAFDNCKSLTNISIPENVTSIGRNAFYGSGITQMTIPVGVTEILYDTFGYCANLTSVTIPSGVTTINEYAFEYCTKLTSIVVPNTVESIGEGGFQGCSALERITLSTKITSIQDFLFENCTKLKTITIPSNVTSIGNRAFRGCTALETILIPDNVTIMNSEAFENCTSLASVTLSNNISIISNETFYNCSALTSIIIPSEVNTIMTSAFENCSSLKSVTILPSSYIILGDNAFMGLPEDSYIYVPNSTIQAEFVDGTNYDSTKTTISIK